MKDFYTLSDVQLVKRIGNKVKAVRLKRNITQQSLAEAGFKETENFGRLEYSFSELVKNCGVPQKMIDGIVPHLFLNI